MEPLLSFFPLLWLGVSYQYKKKKKICWRNRSVDEGQVSLLKDNKSKWEKKKWESRLIIKKELI